MTAVGTTSAPGGADTVGADNAHLTGISGAHGADTTADASGNYTVQGSLGTLTINADGSYTYVANADNAGGNDVFTYTLTDGDGDTTTATLTITVPVDLKPTLDVPDEGQAGTIVDEKGLPPHAGLPAGSGESADGNPNNNSDTSETTNGTIHFTQGDAPATVKIDGVTVTGVVGQTFVGDHGTLTITGYNAGTGTITYSYTLTESTSGDNTSDSFNIVVTDSDGDTASGTLNINIVDDVPTAHNDTDSTDLVNHIATGNVITGVDTTSGAAGADVLGADGAAVSGVASNNVPANVDNNPAGDFVVAGQFGTLTLHPDGSYSYQANEGVPGGSSDVFTYTLTDGDGDTSTATLTITNPDHTPTIVIETPDNPAGAVNATESVNEKGLPERGSEPAGSGEIADGNGTNDSDSSETNTGTIVFSSADGVASVTVNGTAITTVGQMITGSFGVMTITSINLVTGQIGYSYTLSDNTSGDATHDDFSVVVTDTDGDTATGTLKVNIIDDVPTAHNDTDASDAVTGIATGNVITGVDTTSSPGGIDVVGADNAQVAGLASNNVPANVDNNPAGDFVVVGQFGTLTLHADGSYSYQANPGAPGGSNDVFTYTLQDGDGDTSTATLTITIADHTPTIVIETPDNPAGAVNATESVNEKGLAPRGAEPPGSGEIADGNPTNNSDTSETNTGTIVFSSQDGVASVTVNGTAITTVGQMITGSFGVMTITSINLVTGQIGYSYTLSDNTSGNSTHDDFSVVVTDNDGDTATGTLKVNIIDDVPTAHNDTDTVAAGTYGPELGNVITGVGTTSGAAGADVVGADNALVSALASNNVPANVDNNAAGGFVVHGQYGTLTLQADGSYSYARDAGTPGGVNDVFTYTLTDGDGDTTTATLTINIADAGLIVHAPVNVGLDDDALAGGNAGGTGDDPDSVNVTGSVAATGGDGPLTYSLNTTGNPSGFTYAAQGNGDVWVMQGATHVLTVHVDSATGAYSVSQVNPIVHAAGGDENNQPFALTYTVTDKDGDTVTGTINISVDDDTPTLGVIQPIESDNNPTNPDGTGTLHFSAGADHFGSVTITPDLTGLSSGGHALVGSQTGNVYTAYADLDHSGTVTAGDTAVFTITVDPNAGTSGQYVFDLIQPLDGTVTNTLIGGSAAFGAGPAQAQSLTGGGHDLAVISGWNAGGSFDFNNWFNGTNQLPAGLTLHDVNGSTAGWGVDNNNFTSGEFMRFDFGEPMDDFDGAGPYDTSLAPTDQPEASFATFKLTGYSSSEHVYFVVHYTDGTSSSLTVTGAALVAAGSTPFEIDAPAGKFIDWIDLYTPDANGSGKVDLVSVGVSSTNVDHTIPVSMTFTDGDGDSVTGSTTIHVKDGGTATTPNAAINTTMAAQSTSTTSNLVSSNDNHHDHLLRASGGGNNAALIGAVAAVGLTASHIESGHVASRGGDVGSDTLLHTAAVTSVASVAGGGEAQTSHLIQTAAGHDSGHNLLHTVIGHETADHVRASVGDKGHAVTELLHGTDAHAAHGNGGAAPLVAAAIIMPSAQQLAAANAGAENAGLVGNHHVPAGQDVGKVLADALHGGATHGPNLDALINSLPHHAGPANALEALASHGDAHVSNGHTGHFAGFTSAHAPIMEHMMMHQDAVPAHS
jgi:VCBS repeat-containing protein